MYIITCYECEMLMAHSDVLSPADVKDSKLSHFDYYYTDLYVRSVGRTVLHYIYREEMKQGGMWKYQTSEELISYCVLYCVDMDWIYKIWERAEK